LGTVRTFTPEHRKQVLHEMNHIAKGVAAVNGPSVEFSVREPGTPVTYNSPALTRRMLPSLERAAGPGRLHEMALLTLAEDFSNYAQQVPALFFFVGVTPPGKDAKTAPANHSDHFYVDESALPIALKALTQVAVDYLKMPRP
jgi:metal-dependent amidase/aminoacylase/carboxypeptidase family protein